MTNEIGVVRGLAKTKVIEDSQNTKVEVSDIHGYTVGIFVFVENEKN